MTSDRQAFLLLSINHEHVPLEERECYSLDEEQIGHLYQSLNDKGIAKESLVLSTCNRFELYACLPSSEADGRHLVETLSTFHELDFMHVQNHAKIRNGEEAIEHLIEVSAGLRSQITGEAEVFGQVKEAYARCQRYRHAGKVINRVFQKSFQAAKLIRHTTPIGQGQINISNVAVDLSSRIFGDISDTGVLVIGTGDISEKTSKALRSRGVTRFGIASRTLERAEEVAADWGGEALLLDEIDSYLNSYDTVIASTDADSPVIMKSFLKPLLAKRKDRPLFLIDLGLPRNVDQACQDFDEVFLYNLDDLAKIAEDNLNERQKTITESQAIAHEKAEAIWSSLLKRELG